MKNKNTYPSNLNKSCNKDRSFDNKIAKFHCNNFLMNKVIEKTFDESGIMYTLSIQLDYITSAT